MTADSAREFGEGPLARVAALVYTLLVVELLFLATGAPGLVLLVLLGPANLPLAALGAIPLGPAASAALYALQHRRPDTTDLRPLAAFRRGYALNLRAALLVWVPALAWLTIVALTLVNVDAAGVPGWWRMLLVLVAGGVCLWAANALLIVSLFAFRGRDVARLAAYFLARTPGVTLANACLLVVAVAVVALWSEAVLLLLGSVFALALLRNGRAMIVTVREEFTA